jgi:hypothetical protein
MDHSGFSAYTILHHTNFYLLVATDTGTEITDITVSRPSLATNSILNLLNVRLNRMQRSEIDEVSAQDSVLFNDNVE